MTESTDATLPSSTRCDHRDLCGDSLIEIVGDLRMCTSCGANWRDREDVIVNDEVLPSLHVQR